MVLFTGAGMSLFSQVVQTAAGAATAVASGYPARGDEYPSRPIRLVIPYAAGGSGDQIGRPWADGWHRCSEPEINSGPARFQRLVEDELVRLAPLIKSIGLRRD